MKAGQQAQRFPLLADLAFGHAQQAGQVTVRKAALLGAGQQLVGQQLAPNRRISLPLDQLAHLLDEPRLDVRPFEQRLHVGAFAERLVHLELPFAGGLRQHSQQFLQRPLREILGAAQSVAADFDRADRFLERFLVGLGDAHHLADGQHLRAQPVLQTGKFLERPAAEFDHHVVAPGRVLSSVPSRQ
jgi:hypothetical protein